MVLIVDLVDPAEFIKAIVAAIMRVFLKIFLTI
jgi:hypothetical protein